MAEFILNIESPSYEEGDIICAFNDRMISCVHAQHICHPWSNGVNASGLRKAGTVTEDYFLRTHEFKFERISKTEVKRIKLSDMSEETISGTPNASGEYMDVDLFVKRRLAETAPDGGPRLAIFGSPGAEYWFGGTADHSSSKLDLVWDDIEAKTAFRKSSFPLWPVTTQEKKSFLPIRVNDFDDDTSNLLTSSIYDDVNAVNPVLLKKRKHFANVVQIASNFGIPITALRNKALEKDGRAITLNRATIVQAK